ncbi:MAG TPA: hypothetical protein VFK89_04785 [Actinomycetota bacterium]|nr:hypothetical protein [Actinomycetota bacterium]
MAARDLGIVEDDVAGRSAPDDVGPVVERDPQSSQGTGNDDEVVRRLSLRSGCGRDSTLTYVGAVWRYRRPMSSEPEPLVVLRCGTCGETFSSHGPVDRCPACGSEDVDLAHEPLL